MDRQVQQKLEWSNVMQKTCFIHQSKTIYAHKWVILTESLKRVIQWDVLIDYCTIWIPKIALIFSDWRLVIVLWSHMTGKGRMFTTMGQNLRSQQFLKNKLQVECLFQAVWPSLVLTASTNFVKKWPQLSAHVYNIQISCDPIKQLLVGW